MAESACGVVRAPRVLHRIPGAHIPSAKLGGFAHTAHNRLSAIGGHPETDARKPIAESLFPQSPNFPKSKDKPLHYGRLPYALPQVILAASKKITVHGCKKTNR